ncbi:MAG: glycosyl hydrolase family 5 [Dactylosporangium sp.]|nr:cellulose binding domain-containing protein [Dactylosporangium sp.]NNJ62523.1 glycosyl hydrolase family 5 [Dactylosporangium sp.]
MKRRSSIALVAATLVAGAGAAAAIALPAHADTVLCDTWGTTTIQGGKYVVMNNVWGASTAQCINVTDTGFQVTTADHNNSTSGAPASYPAAYMGCHYTNCSAGSPFPATLSSLGNVSSSASISVPTTGEWDAAYDIWLDPTARTDGQNTGAEIMIWVNHLGRPQPAGSKVSTVTLAGATWDVWYGNIGWNVVSYVRQATATSFNDSITSFIDDAVSRGYAQQSWYMTSVQFGFEPWIGGAGLAVNSFSVSTGGTVTSPPLSSASASASPSASASSPPVTEAACSVGYAKNEWPGGFTASVTIANTGSSAINGWTLGFAFPGDSTVTSFWNADVSQSGSNVTATDMSYNGAIAQGTSVSFGFQGTYSSGNANPTAFTLNGSACTVG